MLRVHPRTQIVDAASADLQVRLLDWMAEHDLTYLEALKCLNYAVASYLKYALRVERHPEHPEKKADEA